MQTILQLSDFHIKASMERPEKNKVFVSLVETLKSLNLEDIILIYNGDVIDTKAIMDEIDPKLTLNEKASLWDTGAQKAYEKAEEYFEYLTRELLISNDKVIVCCGNHDINPYYEGGLELSCPNPKKRILYSGERFRQFSNFCNRVQIRKDTWGTYFREIDNINILVVNTNWINKWGPSGRQNLCIACEEIQKVISEKKERLVRTKKDKSKLFNVLVAHAPRTDYCEDSLYRYEDNGRVAIMESIDRLFGLKLYGDKHTDSVHNFDYIVGAPLGERYITCGMHQFDDDFHHHHKSLVFSDNAWKVVGSERDIDEILNISVDSVKKQALEYLFGTRDITDLAVKIQNFEEVRSGENWLALDRLIRAYADIQKPQPKGAGCPIDASDGFINTLTRLISDSTRKVSITLRGEERVGKSVSISLLYMNLLYRFISGTFEYLPVYINIEQIMSQIEGDNRDSQAYMQKLREIISEKLKRGVKLATNLQRPACCIIDGINKFYIYKNAKVEDMIASELESEAGRQYARLVYCIDTGNNTGLGSTPQHSRKDAEYVVYFNRILTKKVNSKKKYRTFVKSYCTLKDTSTTDETARIVLENIERMQILEVDTSLLINFWKDLSQANDISLFEVIENYVGQYITTAELHRAAKACFMYYRNGKSYTEIKKTCNISNDVFELIRTQKLAARYLLAANYVLAIQNSGEDSILDPCLNILYSHEICAFIRQYICKCDAQAQIVAFARMRYKDLSFEGKATISYMLGRIMECKKSEIMELLDMQEHELHLAEVHGADELEFYKSIALRSVRLSKMFTENDTCKCLREYIRDLIKDNYERKINRVFYLQFYGDRKTGFHDYLSEGFDIYYTYNILASRLDAWRHGGKRYTLLDLELFTLCDLLQMRLDSPKAKSSNGKDEVKSFFYNEKFNQPKDDMAVNVLGFIIEIICCYLNQYGNTDENLIFNKYLAVQLKRFQMAKEKITKGPLLEGAFSPEDVLTGLCTLGTEKRIGWGISDVVSEKISEESFLKLRKEEPIQETTLQHTFEAFLIGLLYLPAKSKNNKLYDKQKILNMLLVHDLGETVVGDIIPQYENYDRSREREREFCEELFLQGTRSNIADLSEYLFLWEAWCNNSHEDYNILIAKEIDKIQMLYKLLKLLDEEKVELTGDRIKDFWKAKSMIKTLEGKEIFNILIARNKRLKSVAEKNFLTVSELM